MTSSNITAERKEFVKWFLRNHQLKTREAVWILNYLISDEKLLKNVHFVDDAKHTPCGLEMSAMDSKEVSLCFYYNGNTIANGEQIFNELRRNQGKPLYLQINFQEPKPNSQYIAILEENPYASKDVVLSDVEQLYINSILDKSIVDFKRSQVLLEIDEALDEKNEARFMELVSLLQQLQ